MTDALGLQYLNKSDMALLFLQIDADDLGVSLFYLMLYSYLFLLSFMGLVFVILSG